MRKHKTTGFTFCAREKLEAMAPKDYEEEQQVFSTDEDPMVSASKNEGGMSTNGLIVTAIAVCGAVSIASVISLGVVAGKDSTVIMPAAATTSSSAAATADMTSEVMYSNVPDNQFFDIETVFSMGENTCDGKNPKLENVDCIHLEGPGPQSGANVTKGYKGLFETDSVPILTPYWQNSMCPVNVHWHLGTEHYSVGEYDENGDGPNGNIPAPERRLAEKETRAGFRCNYYDKNDEKFTKEFDWKHCIGMEVGETYEVHWPHSAAGACGQVNQYQTPFYDGVFCTDGVLVDVPGQVGVQAQIFTIVNDEEYFYPDLIRGWIVDGEYGQDIHYYTGSTTGTKRSNEICSQYTPITWQVDRKCHMISASSFDKLCYDMKLQRDDMADDLYAHGSRELVKDTLVANNGQRRGLHEHTHEDAHEHSSAHLRSHAHGGHSHTHDHEWF